MTSGNGPTRCGGGWRLYWRALLLAALASLSLTASSAHASAVTVGNPLTAAFSQGGDPGPQTLTNTALAEPGALLASPVEGLVVRWRIVDASGGPFYLRVLTPNGGDTFTGAGTSSPPRSPTGPGLQTFATSMPIRAGQFIGLDSSTGSDKIGFAVVSNSRFVYWSPPLGDGAMSASTNFLNGEEAEFNADVVPSNTISFGATQRNKKRGTATLNLTLPNPGDLSASGNGVKASSANTAVTNKAVGAGPAELLIKAKGKRRATLNATGKVTLTVAVTFTPTGGDPHTESVKVKLLKGR